MWEKKGLVIDIPVIAGISSSHAAIPLVHRLTPDKYRLFFASRDAASRSQIISADLDFSGGLPALCSLPEITMAHGDLGSFDDSGVMPGWVIADQGLLYMYYSGWSLGKTVPFYNFIGRAKSADEGKSFVRVSKAPVVDRTHADPYLANSPCVLKEGNVWKMWYVSGQSWEQTEQGPKHYYLIRYAHSTDGISWVVREEPCINFASRDEYAIARPCVVPVKGGYLMWYSYRGDSYRIGLAASQDGLSWKRIDDKAGIAPSATGWDSQMVAYAHVFEAHNAWWMLYNGNDYGKTGIGLATTEHLPTLEELL